MRPTLKCLFVLVLMSGQLIAADSELKPLPDVYDLASVQQLPVPIAQEGPEYTNKFGMNGTEPVTVEFIIDTKGDVYDAKVVSAKHAEFGQAALRAVRKWKFKPAKLGGRSVNVRAKQVINFTFGDAADLEEKTAFLEASREEQKTQSMAHEAEKRAQEKAAKEELTLEKAEMLRAKESLGDLADQKEPASDSNKATNTVASIPHSPKQNMVTALGVSLGMSEEAAFAEFAKLEARGFEVIQMPDAHWAMAYKAPTKEREIELYVVLDRLNKQYNIAMVLAQQGHPDPTPEEIMIICLTNPETAEKLVRGVSFPVIHMFADQATHVVTQFLMNSAGTVFAYNSGGMTAKEISEGIADKYKTRTFEYGGMLIDPYYKTKTRNGEMVFVFRDKTVKIADASEAKF